MMRERHGPFCPCLNCFRKYQTDFDFDKPPRAIDKQILIEPLNPFRLIEDREKDVQRSLQHR